MNESESPSTSKPLNLHKFVPKVGKPTSETSPDDGHTMMIRRIAAETAEKNVPAEEAQNDEFGLPLKEMLGVMTYCYARGVFCSKDIAAFLKENPELRKSLGRKLPDEEMIRRFRRRYAADIEETLENVYRVFPEKQTGATSNPTEGHTEIVKRQAAERVHDAVWTDNTKGRLG